MKLYTFGCSFTAGVGLETPTTTAYPSILGNKIGIKNINFGIPGSSNDSIFRTTFDSLKNYIKKDDLIVIQWTHYIRKEIPIFYDNKRFEIYAPSCLYPIEPGILDIKENRVKSKYLGKNNDKIRLEIVDKYKAFFNQYIEKALQEDYQIQTTENYIHSLYNYLEYGGYNHLHFFGWDSCKTPYNFDYSKIIQNETFGGYTNTIGNDHPNEEGHEMWAEFMYKKIKELNYI